MDDIRGQGGEAISAQCNVQDDSAQEAAFAAHLRAWGRLDMAVLNAGIFEKGAWAQILRSMPRSARTAPHAHLHPPPHACMHACTTSCTSRVVLAVQHVGKGNNVPQRRAGDFVDSEGASWQATLDINLRSALVGTRLAALAMTRQRIKGERSLLMLGPQTTQTAPVRLSSITY